MARWGFFGAFVVALQPECTEKKGQELSQSVHLSLPEYLHKDETVPKWEH